MARDRRHSQEWPSATLGVTPLGCRASLRCRRHRDPRAGGLHQRSDPAWSEEAARLPVFWQGMYARASARRHDGLRRGRVRRVPRVRSASRGGHLVKDAILRKARESAEVKEQFFREEADRIEALVRAMAG